MEDTQRTKLLWSALGDKGGSAMHGLAFLDTEAKVFYRPMEAAVRWSGLRRHEVRILRIVGIHHRPPPHTLQRWPLLHLHAGRLFDGMANGDLPYGRQGITCVAPELLDDHPDLTIRHVDLRRWMSRFYPGERPSFLFDDFERQVHPALTVNTFHVLMADRQALDLQLHECVDELETVHAKLDVCQHELDAAAINSGAPVSPRSEATYLSIVGGLVELLLGTSPGGKPYSSFQNTESIIGALVAHHRGQPGISERTLWSKFAAARRHLGGEAP